MTINHETVQLDAFVRYQESPLEGGAICCALDITTRTEEVDQHLVGGDAAGKRQRAVQLVVAIPGNVDHHKVRCRAVDGDGMAIPDAEARRGEHTCARA